MTDNWPCKDEHYAIWWLIVHMRRAMYKATDRELFELGLTPEEAATLFVIQLIGYRATPAEISRWVLREPHTISNLLHRMEQKGLVMRVKDLDRRNMVRIALTEKGLEAHRQSTRQGSMHRMMAVLSLEEWHVIIPYLERLRDAAFAEIGLTKPPPFPKLRKGEKL